MADEGPAVAALLNVARLFSGKNSTLNNLRNMRRFPLTPIFAICEDSISAHHHPTEASRGIQEASRVGSVSRQLAKNRKRSHVVELFRCKTKLVER
jgi:hypothetical protein